MQSRTDVSLAPLTTFGVEAHAKALIPFANADELSDALGDKRFEGWQKMILGGGSNVLFTDDYPGLILKNEVKGIEKIDEDADHVWVRAGAGEVWHRFVMHCIEHDWAGLENLSLIPGMVGASPMQNIGAYGVEIKDRFDSLEAFDLQTGKLETFDRDSCEFGYRESVFKRRLKGRHAIMSVTYKLLKKPELNTKYGAIEGELNAMGVRTPTLRDVSRAVVNIRTSKLPDPAVLGNAGSFFKNPVVSESLYRKLVDAYPSMPFYPAPEGQFKLAAGWLIDKCGWKGYRRGNCGVHERQALVLVNYGGATGQEVYDLSSDILSDIQKKYGVELEREVNILP